MAPKSNKLRRQPHLMATQFGLLVIFLLFLLATSGSSSDYRHSQPRDFQRARQLAGKFPVQIEKAVPQFQTTTSRHHLLPRTNEEWNTAVDNGKKFLEYLANTDPTFMASEWTSYDSLTTWGWEVNPDKDEPTFPGQFSDAFRLLNINENNFKYVAWSQSLEVNVPGGCQYPPSNALYAEDYNVADGVIVADNNWSPGKSSPELRTHVPLNRFSDVAWLEWANQAGDRVSQLRYFFRASIVNIDTKNIVSLACERVNKQLSDWEHRVTFGMDTDEGKAILGTPNGRGAAWFLINHKGQMGLKTISQVVVWKRSWLLHMYFTILDVPS